jgi:hypothetical protein
VSDERRDGCLKAFAWTAVAAYVFFVLLVFGLVWLIEWIWEWWTA